MKTITRETIVERRQPQMRWSAVFAGTVVSVGLWVMLQMLGTGIGLAAIDQHHPDSLRAVGIGTGIWTVIAPLIALFLGGLVAGRLATTVERSIGGLHGLVVWALSTVLGVFATISLVAALATTAVQVGTTAVEAAGTAVTSIAGSNAPQQTASALGIDANDLLAPVNQKLQQEGKPAVTADELAQTVRGVAQRGLHQGKLDREVLVDELARNTQLTRADAEDIANRFGDRYQRAIDQVQRTGEQVQQTALEGSKDIGKGLLWGGIMLLVSLIAAAAGGIAGVRRRPVVEDRPVVTTEP